MSGWVFPSLIIVDPRESRRAQSEKWKSEEALRSLSSLFGALFGTCGSFPGVKSVGGPAYVDYERGWLSTVESMRHRWAMATSRGIRWGNRVCGTVGSVRPTSSTASSRPPRAPCRTTPVSVEHSRLRQKPMIQDIGHPDPPTPEPGNLLRCFRQSLRKAACRLRVAFVFRPEPVPFISRASASAYPAR